MEAQVARQDRMHPTLATKDQQVVNLPLVEAAILISSIPTNAVVHEEVVPQQELVGNRMVQAKHQATQSTIIASSPSSPTDATTST